MENPPLTRIDLKTMSDNIRFPTNLPVTFVNDHVVRISVMTAPYFWHFHPNSDETFLVVEGSVFIDFETETLDRLPGQLFTIPKNVNHCTRPAGERSVNLTFEAQDLTTTKIPPPAGKE